MVSTIIGGDDAMLLSSSFPVVKDSTADIMINVDSLDVGNSSE